MGFRRLNTAVAVDCETTGLDLFHGCKPFAVSLCNEDGVTGWWEWPVDPWTRQPTIPKKDKIDIRRSIDRYKTLVFHHAKFDIRALWEIGIDLTDRWDDVEDTMSIFHVLDSSDKHGLKPLAFKYCNIPEDDLEDLIKEIIAARRVAKKLGWPLIGEPEKDHWDAWLPKAVDPSSTDCKKYGTTDTLRTMRLFLLSRKIFQEPENAGLYEHYERERRLIRVVYNMETAGMALRPRKLASEIKRYAAVHNEALEKIVQFATVMGMENFNVRSSQQLGELLYGRCGFPALKTTPGGKASTDAQTLEALSELCTSENMYVPSESIPVLDAVLEQRGAIKSVEYLEDYRDRAIRTSVYLQGTTGDRLRSEVLILHPNFNQHGRDGNMATTRFSSSRPNAQNVKKGEEDAETGRVVNSLRNVFGPRPGTFWYDCDYDNLEMRLFSYDAGETELIRAFENNINVHKVIGTLLHGKDFDRLGKKHPYYRPTKNGNFSLIYGASERRADATYGVTGAYAKIRGTFKKLDAWMSGTIRDCRKHGYINTMQGYRLYVPHDAPYKGGNYRIQGTAGIVLKEGMLNISDELKDIIASRIIATVHDEIIVEVEGNPAKNTWVLEKLVAAMESPGQSISVPTTVSPAIIPPGGSWAEPREVVLSRKVGAK